MAEENKTNGKKAESSPAFQNFERLIEQVLTVPKEEVDEWRIEYERKKKRNRIR